MSQKPAAPPTIKISTHLMNMPDKNRKDGLDEASKKTKQKTEMPAMTSSEISQSKIESNIRKIT